MTDVIKTSDVAPPSIALAGMAWWLSQNRIHPFVQPNLFGPVLRECVDALTPCSAEYYRIIDCLSRGERP